MKERPVIFSGPMVRAILDGKKTQTRRVMKCQPEPFNAYDKPGPFVWFPRGGANHVPRVGRILESELSSIMLPYCPYGKPGDRLWVRETHAPLYCDHEDGEPPVIYRADGEIENATWTPSIHMRREYSRITLEICSVRVERVQDISEEDAIAEGIRKYLPPFPVPDDWPKDENGFLRPAFGVEWKDGPRPAHRSAVEAYRELWNSIYGKKHPWESNPWDWVIEFRRISDAHSE